MRRYHAPRSTAVSPQGRFRDEFVAFFHPAYPSQTPPLLTLPAVERTRADERGVDYDTALTACGIVACNRWGDGVYFAEKIQKYSDDRDPPGYTVWEKVVRPADGILRAYVDYYFVVDNPEYLWPVVLGFHHWRFPHDSLPPKWDVLPVPEDDTEDNDPVASTSPASSNDSENRPGHKCHHSYSKHCFGNTAAARIAPLSNITWYESNQMDRYCQLHGTSNTSNNTTHISRLKHMIESIFGWKSYTGRHELHPYLILSAIEDKIFKFSQENCYQAPKECAIAIRREHLFARFAFNILSTNNFTFLRNNQDYTVSMFNTAKAEQCTRRVAWFIARVEAPIFVGVRHKSKNITKQFKSSHENQHDYEPHSDDSVWASASCSESSDESSTDSLSSPRGRQRSRSPEYYNCRKPREEIQESQSHARRKRSRNDEDPTDTSRPPKRIRAG
ncbi:putative protein SEY1 [Rosellinia necatrix]|uniref:Uncharacterized protein n=1 Tax=Rosellinia necatrix TaxID=77044 RepID=A0A1W2TWS3_ROSNE|nr:putative protein SEY1 [Rosellinia necatrix]